METSVAHPRVQSIGDLLRRSAQRMGDKTAVVCGGTRWSYRELDAICNRLAHGLTAAGVAKGDRFAVLSRNSHGFVALRFALARIGAVMVPVNFMLKPDEIRFVLTSSGATHFAVGPEFVDVGREAATGSAVARMIALPGEDGPAAAPGLTSFEALLATDATAPGTHVEGADLLQIVYTSGTESLPKGAMLRHDAVMWQYVSCIVDGSMSADDLMLHAMPFFHCAQLDVFLGPAVYLGAGNVVMSAPTPDGIITAIETHGITSFFAPPTIWIGILRSPAFDPARLVSLKKGYYGASIMPVEVLLELQRRLPDLRLWNFYGQTEIAPVATVLKPEDQMRKAGSAGRAALNVETRVVTPEMRDVAVGEVGEIVHRSPHLMSGYYNQPEKTAAAFAGGWFHSGDLGTVDDDGYITVVDRIKDMIKSGGENVASREVEETIYRLPQVSEVAVIGVPDPKWVEAVTAIVVVKRGETLSEDAVREHCAASMAPFKTPKRVIFVDALPRNPSGKLLKRELRKLWAGDSPPVAAE